MRRDTNRAHGLSLFVFLQYEQSFKPLYMLTLLESTTQPSTVSDETQGSKESCKLSGFLCLHRWRISLRITETVIVILLRHSSKSNDADLAVVGLPREEDIRLGDFKLYSQPVVLLSDRLLFSIGIKMQVFFFRMMSFSLRIGWKNTRTPPHTMPRFAFRVLF